MTYDPKAMYERAARQFEELIADAERLGTTPNERVMAVRILNRAEETAKALSALWTTDEFKALGEDAQVVIHDALNNLDYMAGVGRWYLNRPTSTARDAAFWEKGWLAVDVEHRDGVGDINPVSGEPIAVTA